MSGIGIQPAQTATVPVSGGGATVIPVALGYYPAEGSRAVTAQYNWTSTNGFSEDLSQLVARGVETTIQAAFIDNGSNAQSVTLTVSGSGQVVTCPANSQGWFPMLFSGTPAYQITTSAPVAAVTRVHLVNFPITSAAVWHV